jgi:hypothetical protein
VTNGAADEADDALLEAVVGAYVHVSDDGNEWVGEATLGT